MIKNSLFALAALGLAGAVTMTPSAPAQAFFFCGAKATAKPGSWCHRAAERRAKRAELRAARRAKRKSR